VSGDPLLTDTSEARIYEIAIYYKSVHVRDGSIALIA